MLLIICYILYSFHFLLLRVWCEKLRFFTSKFVPAFKSFAGFEKGMIIYMIINVQYIKHSCYLVELTNKKVLLKKYMNLLTSLRQIWILL